MHLTLDARDGPVLERLEVKCPRYELGERKLGNAALLAISVSPGVCQYELTMEQRYGRLHGALKLSQPAVSFAPCFTRLLDSSELASVVTDALRGMDSLAVDAVLSGTWEHPQWSVESNVGSELACQLSRQLQARQLAFQRGKLERVMLGIDAQLAARYEMCAHRCDRIVASMQVEHGELNQLRATVASRMKESDAVRNLSTTDELIRR